jgi:polysaccharide biosynthesis protein PslH
MQAAYGPRFHRIAYRIPPKTKGFVMRCLRWVGKRINRSSWYLWGVDDWYDDRCNAVLTALQRRHHFDAVVVEYVFMSQAFECFTNGHLKILDTHDVMANRHRIFDGTGRAPRHFSTTPREEAKALNRADIVLAIQDREAEFFRTLTSRKVITFGHVTPVDDRYSRNGRQRGNTLLFVGSENVINVDGVRHFLQRIFPCIRSRLGEVELLLAGSICSAVPDQPGVRKLGIVDDIVEAYDLGDVVVNPVLYGTGLNIKSIEALGYGMPLVCSRAGSRGLEAAAGDAYLLAEDDTQFAERVVSLLTDMDLRKQLSVGATKFVEEWNRTQVQRYIDCLQAHQSQHVADHR